MCPSRARSRICNQEVVQCPHPRAPACQPCPLTAYRTTIINQRRTSHPGSKFSVPRRRECHHNSEVIIGVLFRIYKKYRSFGLLRLIGWFSKCDFLNRRKTLAWHRWFFWKTCFNISWFFLKIGKCLKISKLLRFKFWKPRTCHIFLISEILKC